LKANDFIPGGKAPQKSKGGDTLLGIVIGSIFMVIAIKIAIIALITWLWIKYGIPFVWRL
jgi:hypothetical protein